MKRILLATLLSLSFVASADLDEKTAKGTKHSGSLMLGFGSGGTAFGFGYEYMFDQSAGYDGHLRIFPKSKNSNGLTVIGGSMVHHFYKRSWDLSFSPSFNIINIDGPNDNTTFGPGLSISLMNQITDMVSVGFDNARYWVWFEDSSRGLAIDDFAARVRINF